MRNVKKTVYVPAKLEIIWVEGNDILTTSPGFAPGTEHGTGPKDDPNVDTNW